MEPWTVFKWVRRIALSFVAIIGLIWSILWSVYLSKAWSHSTSPQRAIILGIICVYGFSSVLLYLMVVVVFRIWKELLRMLFLLALHISPAVFFTVHRSGFSCTPFDNRRTCDLANLVTLCVIWTISGILLVYAIYLCIMSRVPRPFPLITPNDLLADSALPPSRAPSRAPSMSSVKSATRLLSQVQIQPYSLPLGSPPSYSPSIQSQGSSVPRTIPKKLFIVTADAASVSSDALPRARRGQPLRRGVSYGAMGSPAHPRPADRPSIPGTSSLSSGSSVATPSASAVVPVVASTQSPSTRLSVKRKPVNEGNVPDVPQGSPPSLPNVNPFKDVPSRNPSPESFYSQISMRSAPADLDMGNGPYNPFSRTYGGYLTPYFSYSSSGSLVSIPPQPHPAPPAGRLSNPSMPYMASSHSSNFSYPGTPSDTPTLMARNASVHSLVPSLHLEDSHTPPDVPVDIMPRAPPPHPLSAPPAAYMQTGSGDPSRGPSNTHMPASGRANGVPYGGDVRRYGNAQGTRSAAAGYGYGAAGHRHFVAGIGHDYVGQTQPGPPPMYTRRMAQAYGGPNGAPWREMVMRAANN